MNKHLPEGKGQARRFGFEDPSVDACCVFVVGDTSADSGRDGACAPGCASYVG
jgi:hypothetical protein